LGAARQQADHCLGAGHGVAQQQYLSRGRPPAGYR
jgi:hypothetical protein